MTPQGIVVALIIVGSATYLALVLTPTRWRGRLAARLGRLARNPQTRPHIRRVATVLGRALSPPMPCSGCNLHATPNGPSQPG